ncbi:Hypothetical protein NTJ_07038 [Nesidiocoris tenuis]|uniref:Uncharacterized protein n=1 Tax=Nesidiocoris tenuis TaxID=355587 RepID=A0ABN7ASF8_9HEMI|nr:Hypothetical protein NTJ_07038 [Nesidiocoris tenuis]
MEVGLDEIQPSGNEREETEVGFVGIGSNGCDYLGWEFLVAGRELTPGLCSFPPGDATGFLKSFSPSPMAERRMHIQCCLFPLASRLPPSPRSSLPIWPDLRPDLYCCHLPRNTYTWHLQ